MFSLRLLSMVDSFFYNINGFLKKVLFLQGISGKALPIS
jgi:hypothetical protein